MPRRVVPSASLCEEIMDSCAEIMWSNMPDNVQIEGNTSEDDSTSTYASSMSFEKAKDACFATIIAVPMPLEETMNDDTYSYVAPQDVEMIVQQIPCENQSHIAKLSESEKSEMCDSTKFEVECINIMSVRNTPHQKRELHCKTCEDDFNTNKLISTCSIISPHV